MSFKRKFTNGQEVHEKMLTNHQGNANQNHYETLLHQSKNAYCQNDYRLTRAGEDVGKGNLCTLWVGM
jgi:hypothetical protein